MKNFLSSDNLNFEEKESISNFIQSSSEVSECSITNVLDENSSSIWISNEELPQTIILNLSRSFFKEYPKKLAAIGIYCWHAYPTNPKLVEVLISKNHDNNYISFGNFDLCLKPGRQLLQLDEENDTNFLNTENNNYSLKILIKETFGDKRTYINNIYLYENIDFMGSGIINSFNGNDTIKEEDDSNSIFYLRESRERTLPRKKINNSVNNNISTNRLNNDISNISNNNININNNNNQIPSQSYSNQNNIMNKMYSDELKNKDLTIDEFEIITKTKNKDNKLNDNKNNKENFLIKNNNYENDESNIIINNNIIGTESQFNITEISEKNNQIKNDDITNQNILLTKTNDEIDEKLNNSHNNNNINEIINNKNIDNEKISEENKQNKKGSNAESLDVTLSSDDLESFGILKGTKTHHNNFFNPPKISQSNEELDNLELQHSSGDNNNAKNKIDLVNKKIMENYFNMQNAQNKNSNKKKQHKVNSMSQKNIKNEDNIINVKQKIKTKKNNNNQNEINQLKEELSTMKNEFEKYKKEQEEINKKYQDKISSLEAHVKKLYSNNNKMSDVVRTLLEAQYIQNQTNNDFITNQMKRIATETFVNIFSNITQLANLTPQQNPIIAIPNPNQEPIDKINDKERQTTYQTARRNKYSIDKINKKLNNKSLNNIEINDSKDNNQVNKIYNKKINETNIKANKLKKYNSGRNIILRKNYISQSNININNQINPEKKNNNYINNESSENNKDNLENINKEQINDNYFYQTGYPTDEDKNNNPFQKVQKINNINQDEILKINNNNFDENILSNRKEIIHKRLLSNYYRKKNSSPIKKMKRSYIAYPESGHLYPETTANISNQNKNINFNINENEEENSEIYSEEDVPLKVSQLKTEKGNYIVNNGINKNKEKNNYDEEKENECEIDNETRTNSEARDTYNLKKNKIGDKMIIEKVNKNMNINNVGEEQKSTKDSDKVINNKKRRTKSKKNESLINLIQQYNINNKEINKANNE